MASDDQTMLPEHVFAALKVVEGDHKDFVQVFLKQRHFHPAALIVDGGGGEWRLTVSGSGLHDKAVLQVAAAACFAKVVVAHQSEPDGVTTWGMVPIAGDEARLIILHTAVAGAEVGTVTRSWHPCDCWSTRKPDPDELAAFEHIIGQPPYVIVAVPSTASSEWH